MSQINKCNFISKLRLDDGLVVEDEAQIREALVNFYNIFTSSNPTNFDPIFNDVEARITPQMNASLTRDFTTLEVECAFKQMKSLIVPGLDGMPLIFYKNYWNIIGQDVIDAFFLVLNSGSLLASIDHTFIPLIPKVKSLERAKDFWLISLCNILYKIISKVIANRLKKFSLSWSRKLRVLSC